MYFYGMSLDEVENANYIDLMGLYDAITIIEAQEQLKAFEVADWPRLKPGERRKKHKELYGKAYPRELRPKKYVDIKDVQKTLASLRG